MLQTLSRRLLPNLPEWLRLDGFNDITPFRCLTRKHRSPLACIDRAVFAPSSTTLDMMPPKRTPPCSLARYAVHWQQSRGPRSDSCSIRRRNEGSRRCPYHSKPESSSFASLRLPECCSQIVADTRCPSFIVEPALLNITLCTLLAHVHIVKAVIVTGCFESRPLWSESPFSRAAEALFVVLNALSRCKLVCILFDDYVAPKKSRLSFLKAKRKTERIASAFTVEGCNSSLAVFVVHPSPASQQVCRTTS